MTSQEEPLGTAGSPQSDERDTIGELHHHLRTAILRCELPSGVPMSQVQLSKQLGVGRTPLREALRMLQHEGLIEGEPNRRIRIANLSVPDLDELYAMRISLETLAIRLTVPKLTSEDLAQLQTDLVRMDQFAKVQDYDQWEVPHQAFHSALVKYAGPRQLRFIDQLSDHAERYRRAKLTHRPRAWSTGMQEHHDIFTACAARNTNGATERLARHYSMTVLNLIAILDPEYEPIASRTALRSALRGTQMA